MAKLDDRIQSYFKEVRHTGIAVVGIIIIGLGIFGMAVGWVLGIVE